MTRDYWNKFSQLTFNEKHQVIFNIVGVTVSLIIGCASFSIAYSQFHSSILAEKLARLEKHRASQVDEIKRSRQAFAVKAPNVNSSKMEWRLNDE